MTLAHAIEDFDNRAAVRNFVVEDNQILAFDLAHDGIDDHAIIGYAMLVDGVDDDPDVARAVEIRPAAELSKMYVLPDYHGGGWSATLMERALGTAAEWGIRCVWLGVNRENQRAQRFYTKNGFRITGTRTFQVGDDLREHDYVMIRELS